MWLTSSNLWDIVSFAELSLQFCSICLSTSHSIVVVVNMVVPDSIKDKVGALPDVSSMNKGCLIIFRCPTFSRQQAFTSLRLQMT